MTKPLRITAPLNGEVTQDDTTVHLIKSLPDLVAYVSTFMTLKPADIIATGTPGKLKRHEMPRSLKAGHMLEIECPAVAVLRNRVATEQ